MIYSVNQLRADTVGLITTIDKQIAAVEARAKEVGVEPHLMEDSSGHWPLIPLLAAKATAYNTLVMLQTPEATSRARPGHR